MRLVWEAAYLDGRTAARRPATVQITRTGLDVAVPESGARFFWPFREIRQTQGTYAGEQVRLEHGGALPEALLIADVGFLSAARAASPEAAHLHEPGRRRARVGLTVGALLLAIVLAAGVYYIAIPGVARVAAARVPVTWEEQLGGAIVEQFAPVARRCEDPARQARIDAIVARLTAQARPQPYTFHVTVMNTSIVNALAAPGGQIILFRGLLERTENAEELAGVLAHEIEHVLHRHVTRAIFQRASTSVLVTAMVGDVSGVAYALEAARTLGDLQMTRAAEREADRDGMRLLQQAGIDPRGMITFFEKLAKIEGEHGGAALPRYLRTHPATAERIATLRTLAAAAPPPRQRLLPDDEWDNVKSLCGELPRSPKP